MKVKQKDISLFVRYQIPYKAHTIILLKAWKKNKDDNIILIVSIFIK